MKKRTTTIIVILMILTGLSLLLYPTVSDYLKNLAYRRTISNYNATVDSMDNERYEELLAAARDYNERLAKKSEFMLILSDEERAEYNSLLNIDDTGVIGYVSVPKVDISLPIFHGTSDGVLQNGVGHLEGSSLPVGGSGTHAVLSAHTGLPSAKLFTNIDQLIEGDTFSVRVLKETLTYQVDQILVVLPYQTDALRIEQGKDYCTLVTCTPYGVNSHRLLVRGHRIPTPLEEETSSNIIEEDLINSRLLRLAVTLGFLFVAVLLLVAFLRVLQRHTLAKPMQEIAVRPIRESIRPIWKRAKQKMKIAVLLPVAFAMVMYRRLLKRLKRMCERAKLIWKRAKQKMKIAVLLPVAFVMVMYRRLLKRIKRVKKEKKSSQDPPET